MRAVPPSLGFLLLVAKGLELAFADPAEQARGAAVNDNSAAATDAAAAEGITPEDASAANAESPEAATAASCSEGALIEGLLTFEVEEQTAEAAVTEASLLSVNVVNVDTDAVLYAREAAVGAATPDAPLRYSACVVTPDFDVNRVLVRAQLSMGADDSFRAFAGENSVSAGSEVGVFTADIMLTGLVDAAGVEEDSGASTLTVAICDFGAADDEAWAIAIEASVALPGNVAELPKPSTLTVVLEDISDDEEEEGEAQTVAVYTGEASDAFKSSTPLAALLCAKIPGAEELAMYAISATLKVGGDGAVAAAEGEAAGASESRAPRPGDFVTRSMMPVMVVPGTSNYNVEILLQPYIEVAEEAIANAQEAVP